MIETRPGRDRGRVVLAGGQHDGRCPDSPRRSVYQPVTGRALDAAGIRWTILSAFRDDYRQGLASGYKARTDNSLHGGSAAIGGYGHGCAVDIADPDHKSDTLWKWLDANGAQVGLELGLQRPFPGIDPSHILPRGAWHDDQSELYLVPLHQRSVAIIDESQSHRRQQSR